MGGVPKERVVCVVLWAASAEGRSVDGNSARPIFARLEVGRDGLLSDRDGDGLVGVCDGLLGDSVGDEEGIGMVSDDGIDIVSEDLRCSGSSSVIVIEVSRPRTSICCLV